MLSQALSACMHNKKEWNAVGRNAESLNTFEQKNAHRIGEEGALSIDMQAGRQAGVTLTVAKKQEHLQDVSLGPPTYTHTAHLPMLANNMHIQHMRVNIHTHSPCM